MALESIENMFADYAYNISYKLPISVLKSLLQGISQPEEIIDLIAKRRNSNESNIFQIMAVRGDVDAFECVLAATSEDKLCHVLRSQGLYGNTMFHYAAFSNQGQILRLTLNKVHTSSDQFNLLKISNRLGFTAIHYAAWMRSVDFMETAFAFVTGEQFFNLLGLTSLDELSPLGVAVEYGHINIVNLILDKLSPDQIFNLLARQNSMGITILHLAALKDNIDIVKALLNSVETPDQIRQLLIKQDRCNQTAEDYASDKGLTAIVNLLQSCWQPANSTSESHQQGIGNYRCTQLSYKMQLCRKIS